MTFHSKDSRGLSVEFLCQQPLVVDWTQRLLDSFYHWTHKELIVRNDTPQAQSQLLFESSFVVVSHGPEADPILNYGNRAALDLWELDWDELRRTPSRLTAEPLNRAERAQMLDRANQHGFIDDYRGIRISKSGKRFLVERAIVWNVVDLQGNPLGQAATFSQWQFLKSESTSP